MASGDTNDDVRLVPIEKIRVLNPRHRDRRKFEAIVESIRKLGLKKPIQVSLRSEEEGQNGGYDLVCGQGRIEAFRALGHTEIPAIVVDVSKEERLLRSLVENMARRYVPPLALMAEIGRLRQEGYTNVQIGKKLDIPDTTVGGYVALSKAGEERLLDLTLRGEIPVGVAMDIAKCESIEMQRELLKAYEKRGLNLMSIRRVKRVMERRRFFGKGRERGGGRARRMRTSAEALVTAYRRESERQKAMIRKAKVCEAKLVFIVTALQKLMADGKLRSLLEDEGLGTMPKYLWEKVRGDDK